MLSLTNFTLIMLLLIYIGGVDSDNDTKIVELHTNSSIYEEQANFGRIYTFNLDKDKHSCTLMFHYSVKDKREDNKPIKAFITSPDATTANPLLVGIRQQLTITSWQVPLDLNSGHLYSAVGRILCPIWNYEKFNQEQNITVYVSTDSITTVNVHVALTQVDQFFIHMNEEIHFSTTPSIPTYFEGIIPDDVDSIHLIFHSNSDYCSVVSIQPAACPVYDLERNVMFVGSYLTVTRKGSVTIKASDFKNRRFYIVIVVQLSDSDCTDTPSVNNTDDRVKEFTLKMEEVISGSKLQIAIFLVPSLVTALCILICLIHRRLDGHFWDKLADQRKNYNGNCQEEMNETQATDEIDNICVYVSHLGEPQSEIDNFKNKGYFYITLIVVILYAMPVSKLVYNYEKLKVKSGNLDVCYYNTLCMYSWHQVSSLNNVLSNNLYIILGISFIAVVLIRYKQYLYKTKQNRHFAVLEPWIFCGMGIALIGEGIMSSCYHICPNKSNFLFDTSFMYLIAAICMVKTYHFRRPNMNISAYSFFLLYSCLLVFGLFGEIWKSVFFWILYFITHIFVCLYSITRIYIKKQWTLDRDIFSFLYKNVKTDWQRRKIQVTPVKPVQTTSGLSIEEVKSGPEEGVCQTHDPNLVLTRIILLLSIFAINFSMALYALIKQPNGFATHLLLIFIGNLVFYITYFIIMKIRSGDFLCPSKAIFHRFSFYYSILALLCWIPAMYFFYLTPVTKWSKTPAESRSLNQPCIFLDFYDAHDVWHFLSAGGLFFSFLMIVTMDDDIIHIPQKHIMVF